MKVLTKFEFFISVKDSKNNSTSSSSIEPTSHFYNYQNDIYCMNVNPPPANQFLNYHQNYHHEQIMHHQYFDESSHTQNYNFIPYPANEAYATSAATNEQIHHQENFPSVQSNELYEFLPEEIFQLDQPIVKTELQTFNANPIVNSMDALQLPFTSHNADISSTSHSFLDLSSGQIQTNAKYPMTVDGFSSEINNNYHQQNSTEATKVADMNAYSYQMNESSPRLNCAVESEKVLKRKHLEIDPVVKLNPPTLHQNFHQPLFTKRENSCLLQQATSYYPPDLYANFPSKPNEMYRSMEKYNSYITNN